MEYFENNIDKIGIIQKVFKKKPPSKKARWIYRLKDLFRASMRRWKIQKVMQKVTHSKFGKETLDLVRLRNDIFDRQDAFAENIFKMCWEKLE